MRGEGTSIGSRYRERRSEGRKEGGRERGEETTYCYYICRLQQVSISCLPMSLLPHLLFLELRAHEQHREGGRGGREEMREGGREGGRGGREGGREGGSTGVRGEHTSVLYRQQVQCMHITGSYMQCTLYMYCTHTLNTVRVLYM